MPQPAVYADLYVFVNTSMDLLCLNLTAAILHRRTRRWRVLLAALLGGLFSLAVLLAGVDGLPGVLLDLSAAFGICAVAYPVRHERPRVFFATVAAFFLISLLLGGMMTVLFGWLNRLPLPSGALSEDHISVWLFAVLALVSGFLTRRGGRFLGFSSRAKAATAEAVLFGKPVVLRAMVDTANLLRDPTSGRSVILCDASRLRRVLPAQLFLPVGDPARLQWENDHANARRVRPVPASTASGSSLLTAVVPDDLVIADSSGRHPASYLLALADLGDRAAGFDALLPPS